MDYLMLVDKLTPLPENFEEKLVLNKIQGLLLEHQACQQCQRMIEQALCDGVAIKVLSAFRTRDYQQILWENNISKLIGEGLKYEDAVNATGRVLAMSGHSEHHCGLAVDFATPDSDDTQGNFYATTQGKWLCKNAHKYGFILRYPRMKEHITGISYEPWHYRYVGFEAAEFIKESGLCLEEFLHFYSENFI